MTFEEGVAQSLTKVKGSTLCMVAIINNISPSYKIIYNGIICENTYASNSITPNKRRM